MEKLFETAIRNKYRFNYRGLITTEDLWDLKVEALDSIYKDLVKEAKKSEEESLLEVKTKEAKEVDCKIEIVKYIVKTKLEEKETRKQAAANRIQKQRILELINEKEDESLKSKSIDELKKMVEELE